MTTAMKGGRGYVLARAEDGTPAPTLYLYDVLGVDLFGGVAARQVIDDLAALGPVDALDVRINSPGGDVFEGIAVYNALARFPAKVTVHIDGLAASAATLVAMAGNKIAIAENAMVMVHRPWTALMGDAPELRRQAETLDKAWSSMLATYARRTGRRAATFEQRVAAAGGEWWMTADEAVAEGFADAVTKPEKQAQVFGLHRFKQVPAQLAASAGDAPPAACPTVPRVAEIAAPRIETPAREVMPLAQRRRIVEVLRLSS
ncbi:MAG: ATP-dependent Clp protease proteolytic subunit [Planctomycetes bacterium]|nr:ATP-dependent Clp protease proteolytic subunit [Planctomycetota bacterium]